MYAPERRIHTKQIFLPCEFRTAEQVDTPVTLNGISYCNDIVPPLNSKLLPPILHPRQGLGGLASEDSSAVYAGKT
jgi:hypothetical protein